MKILFEKDLFALSDQPTAGRLRNSWIFHRSCSHHHYTSTKWDALVEHEVYAERCMFCLTPIPTEVLALWRLHNWDYELKQ